MSLGIMPRFPGAPPLQFVTGKEEILVLPVRVNGDPGAFLASVTIDQIRNGVVSPNIQQPSGNYTAQPTDNAVIFLGPPSGTVLTLPSSAATIDGHVLRVTVRDLPVGSTFTVARPAGNGLIALEETGWGTVTGNYVMRGPPDGPSGTELVFVNSQSANAWLLVNDGPPLTGFDDAAPGTALPLPGKVVIAGQVQAPTGNYGAKPTDDVLSFVAPPSGTVLSLPPSPDTADGKILRVTVRDLAPGSTFVIASPVGTGILALEETGFGMLGGNYVMTGPPDGPSGTELQFIHSKAANAWLMINQGPPLTGIDSAFPTVPLPLPGKLIGSGGVQAPSGNFTASPNDDVISFDAPPDGTILTLPASAATGDGKVLRVKIRDLAAAAEFTVAPPAGNGFVVLEATGFAAVTGNYVIKGPLDGPSGTELELINFRGTNAWVLVNDGPPLVGFDSAAPAVPLPLPGTIVPTAFTATQLGMVPPPGTPVPPNAFLRADGQWQEPPAFAPIPANTVLANFGPAPQIPAPATGSEITGILDIFTAVARGLVPPSGGGATDFLRADGIWADPGSGGAAPGLTPIPAKTVLGNVGNVSAVPTAVNINLLTLDLSPFTLYTQGVVPPAGPGPSPRFLTADGNWVAGLPLSGGTMTGPIVLAANPTADMQAANKLYVDEAISNQALYQGVWDADTNTPDLSVTATHRDGFMWIVSTPDPNLPFTIVATGIPGLTGEEVHTGDRVIWSNAASEFQIVPGGGLTQTQGDARYLQLIGGSLTGPGDLAVGGTLGVTGVATLAGNATVGGTLGVTGATTLAGVTSGNSQVNGTLGVTGVATLAGNATVGGTLGVTGATTLAGVTSGNSQVNGTLGVTGVATLAGNATVGGTLGVTGATTLAGVTSGNSQVNGTLGVTGAATLASLGVTGAASVGGTLTLAADPTANLQAATKQYVDTRAVPTGGAANAVLRKTAATDYATAWTVILPAGGAAGTVPRKNSATDWDITWSTNGLVPAGGAAGTVPRKNSATDWDITWSTNGLVPAGGAAGQVLRKSAATDYSLAWQNDVPAGGTTGQILRKTSNTDWAMQWANGLPTGGSAGQALVKNTATDFDLLWRTLIPAAGAHYQVLHKSAATDYSVAWTWTGVRGTSVVLGNATTMEATPSGLSSNVVVGVGALKSMTTGYDDVCIGHNAWPNSTIHSANVVIGSKALQDWTTSDLIGGVYIGFEAGRYLNAAGGGSHTIAIGHRALGSIDTNLSAARSVFIGSNSRPLATGQSNQIVIGEGAAGNGTNTVTLGNSSILATNGLFCRSTTIVAPSDARLKQDIEPANLDLCLEAVRKLPVRRFHWNEQFTDCNDKHVTGFVAQDVERVFPKSVVTGDLEFNGTTIKDCKQTGLSDALPTLWGAVQALIARCEELERKLEAANGRVH